MNRCSWCGDDPLYIKYHDEEWAVPVHEDKKHFEFLVLESAQAGLSWLTVLRKRENYRRLYDNFDPVKVASFNEKKISQMLNDPGIIRNRLKIQSSISNAQLFLAIQEEFGSFDQYIWSFVNHKPVVNNFKTLAEIPANSPLSDTLSNDLKKRGFKFMGTTIVYAHMQACGLVNDHTVDCFRHAQVSS